MRKLVLFIAVLLVTINVSAQDYKRAALKTMGKTTLTEIYLNNVSRLCVNLPYAPFTLYGRDSCDHEATCINLRMDIPHSEYFNSKRITTTNQSIQYGDVIRMHFYEILPYADKNDLIEAILYLQKVNNDIKPQKKSKRLYNLNKLMY